MDNGQFGRTSFNPDKFSPTPAALAAATRITEAQFKDVYYFATFLDGIAEEARFNERKRIFSMGFWELSKLFWESKKLYVKGR